MCLGSGLDWPSFQAFSRWADGYGCWEKAPGVWLTHVAQLGSVRKAYVVWSCDSITQKGNLVLAKDTDIGKVEGVPSGGREAWGHAGKWKMEILSRDKKKILEDSLTSTDTLPTGAALQETSEESETTVKVVKTCIKVHNLELDVSLSQK